MTSLDLAANQGMPIGTEAPERLEALEGFDGFDDSLIFPDSIGLDEEPLFSANWDQHTPPYDHDGLYSASLNWEPPKTKIEYTAPIAYATMSALTPAQQEKLRSIAMPSHLQYNGQRSAPSSTSMRKSQSVSSPESNASRKRKSSADVEDDDDEDSGGQNPPVKKTAHNMIEKRYRTNLNDKIAALRDSVPSLRIMSKSARGEDTVDDREDLQGLTPAHKLNKATVLSKATEYINHLEKRNKRLQDDNAYMKGRIDAFEKLFMSGAMGINPQPQYTQPFQYPNEYDTPNQSPGSESQGMIQVPEDIRRLQTQNQQIFAVPQENYQQSRRPMGPNGWGQTGGYFGKLMVGSLAGLMIMEGFSQAEQESDSPNARGLFALPTQLLSTVSRSIHSSLDLNVLGYHVSAGHTIHCMKLFFVLGALLALFVPSLFAKKPKAKDGKTHMATLAAAPSLASSIQVRRQAWLTAIQTVWVPRHNFFLEAAALCLKMVKLSIRNIIGTDGYAYLTGCTQQQEAARVKAWEIALDAQLAGGDVEVSKSRLTLTLLASGTLPDTPARLMLKALHIRVLLWEVGNAGFNGFHMFQEVTAKMARWKWNEAKQLQHFMAHTKAEHQDELPEYLSALLEQDCDDVLVDSIGQRAYNLAWNLPTTNNTQPSAGMDGVVEDFAIKSPLDAVAAWWSSLVLQKALSASLTASASDAVAEKAINDNITLAIKTAPTGSGAQLRALVARAVLVKEKRGTSIAAALQALGPAIPKADRKEISSTLINTSSSLASLQDINISLRCAMAIAHLERFQPPDNPITAHRIINSINPANLTPLDFASCFKLMEVMSAHELVAASCNRALERMAGNLRIWMGGKEGETLGLGNTQRRALVGRCLDVTKKLVGMERDAGYESMSDDGPGC
ncbi:sterol regulatory element-binding 1 [Hyphodiscus hymeniophilus]|uniref:Sterol regulatory element-binding 1 n=1 Tax=Hyphodiscus hymeniophilus TaxID=353542 RepID=A0A9P6VKU3_9HELO|nr:sterol regulatory element-binding 1 [Hyphodiscus hymeniophilus]